jgi:hypothetical protein
MSSEGGQVPKDTGPTATPAIIDATVAAPADARLRGRTKSVRRYRIETEGKGICSWCHERWTGPQSYLMAVRHSEQNPGHRTVARVSAPYTYVRVPGARS